MAYWPTGGGGRGWEDLGEGSFDIDEDSAPVFFWSYVLIEPLEGQRAEALDVYGTAELYTTMVRSDKAGKREKGYLIGLKG